MKKHFNDPRPITVRYTGDCAECGTILKSGTSAYYWPSDGRLYCKSCDESEYRQFLSAASDEAVYQGSEIHSPVNSESLSSRPVLPGFFL